MKRILTIFGLSAATIILLTSCNSTPASSPADTIIDYSNTIVNITVVTNTTNYIYTNSYPSNLISPNIGQLNYVPAGVFQYDSSITDVCRITKAFYMGIYDITRAQWAAVTGFSDPSTAGISISCPVDTISWYEAIYFCNILSMEEGLTPVYTITNCTNPTNWGPIPMDISNNSIWDSVTCNYSANGYRLPTEMEWMWAAMGADSGNPGRINLTGYEEAFSGWGYNGDFNSNDFTWTSVNDGSNTEPVGMKFPNALGLFDISGNIMQWCFDWYGNYPETALTDPAYSLTLAPDPLAASRVMRGGSYFDNNSYTAVACRYDYYPFFDDSVFGLRVVRP